MILCYPYPGTPQSENMTLRCFQLVYISSNTFYFKLEQRSFKNLVPGEIELAMKFSLFSTPIFDRTSSKISSSLADLNLLSLDWLIFALGATPSKAMYNNSWGFTVYIRSRR